MKIDNADNVGFINDNDTVEINSDVNLKTNIIDDVEENNSSINTDVNNKLSENFKKKICIACDIESADTKCSECSEPLYLLCTNKLNDFILCFLCHKK